MNNLGLESARCAAVQVTTLADVTKPVIAYAAGFSGPTTVTLAFGEPVEQASASVAANYGISGAITVSSAALQPDLTTVVLTVSSMTNASRYTVTVNNVRDRAITPNVIAANSAATFTYVAPITRIRYFPRSGFGGRMVGGIFEGTTGNRDTGEYSTVFAVSSQPANTWTEVTNLQNTNRGFRYVRYRGNGFCNVAEIEFYQGSQKANGAVFGTSGSYANSGNDFTKAFDGNTSTFMDFSYDVGGYTGLDLLSGDPPVGRAGQTARAARRIAAVVLSKGNSSPRIELSAVPDRAQVSVGIYDTRGRLLGSAQGIGLRSVDAKGSDGTELAAGRYVLRVSVDGSELLRSITLAP